MQEPDAEDEDAHFGIQLAGRAMPGFSSEAVARDLTQVLHCSSSRAWHLLSQPDQLGGHWPRHRAERLLAKLQRIGVDCSLLSSSLVQQQQPPLAIPRMRCPKCGHEQPPSAICGHCGVVVAKFRAPELIKANPADRREGYRLINLGFQGLLLLSLMLSLLSYAYKDRLPEPAYYQGFDLSAPEQTRTEREPFNVQNSGIDYHIEPVANYHLRGVVMSYHDSDQFSDIYHRKDWNDYLNIRDLCVIWGENVRNGVYLDMSFENTTWTCWATSREPSLGVHFHFDQLSNNHLLSPDPQMQQAIMGARPGDVIAFSGVLAQYSNRQGFYRGTSISRADTGNGACETVFIDDFQVIHKANAGWRRLFSVALGLLAIATLGTLIMLFIAPVRPLS